MDQTWQTLISPHSVCIIRLRRAKIQNERSRLDRAHERDSRLLDNTYGSSRHYVQLLVTTPNADPVYWDSTERVTSGIFVRNLVHFSPCQLQRYISAERSRVNELLHMSRLLSNLRTAVGLCRKLFVMRRLTKLVHRIIFNKKSFVC